MNRRGKSGEARPVPCAGFTLIEVLVAVVILSICIVVVLSRFNTSLVALGACRDNMWAGLLIKEKLAEAEASIPESGKIPYESASGRYICPGGSYLWDVRIRRLQTSPVKREGDGEADTLNEVTINARREGSGRVRTVVSYVRTAGPRVEMAAKK